MNYRKNLFVLLGYGALALSSTKLLAQAAWQHTARNEHSTSCLPAARAAMPGQDFPFTTSRSALATASSTPTNTSRAVKRLPGRPRSAITRTFLTSASNTGSVIAGASLPMCRSSTEHETRSIHRWESSRSAASVTSRSVRSPGIFRPPTENGGNVAVSASLKLPTGIDNATGSALLNRQIVKATADQSLQPGDGAWGFNVGTQGYKPLWHGSGRIRPGYLPVQSAGHERGHHVPHAAGPGASCL